MKIIPGVVWLLILFLAGMGCDQQQKIKYKLSDDQLAQLMLDIQLSEVILSDLLPGKKDSLKEMLWLRLTKTYQLTEPEIQEEIQNLESDPDKLKEIIERAKMISDSIR